MAFPLGFFIMPRNTKGCMFDIHPSADELRPFKAAPIYSQKDYFA